MKKVLCSGLTCCDLIFSDLERFPEPGKEVASRDFFIKAGGAANTAMALTRLGIETIYCTLLGNDITGNIVYKQMKSLGMNMDGVICDDKYRTSVSAVLSGDYDRAFATYFCKTDYHMLTEVINKYILQSSHIHVFLDDCFDMPIIEMAEKYNKTISMDMGWNENIKIENIRHMLEKVNIFMCNELEAFSITDTDSAEDAATLISEYADIAIVKLGSEGSIIGEKGKLIKIPAVKSIKVVDTTGAGDLYGAGFVYGYLNGLDTYDAARFASASGALAVTFYGGMDEKYSMEKVNELYQHVGNNK